MPSNDKPRDTQGAQPGNNASVNSAAQNNGNRAAGSGKKGAQNAAKGSDSSKRAAGLSQRPKLQASASGNKPPAAKSSKLGAFQPLRGVPNTALGTHDWNPFEPNSREFLLLADAYNFAMRLLERPDTTAKLVQLGLRCVKEWNSNSEETGYRWPGDGTKMRDYVKYFLEQYRTQTTKLRVSATPISGTYAETTFELGYSLPDFFRLDPKALTSVVLDKELFGRCLQNDTRRAELFASGAQKNGKDLKAFARARKECSDLAVTYQALLGAIIFHELAHCFVFYLGTNGDPDTPPDVHGASVASDMGESGAWLETHVLGGEVVVKDNALYLVDTQERGYEVDVTRIKELINKPESFDLRNGLPTKINGRKYIFKSTRRSTSVTPDTRQRAMFSRSKKHAIAYDILLGRDADGLAMHTSNPKAVTLGA